MNLNKKIFKKNIIGKIWILFILLFTIEVFLLIWCRIQCRESRYKISEYIKKNDILLEQQKKLKVELAYLKSPERIAEIAKDKLELNIPKQEQMMMIP